MGPNFVGHKAYIISSSFFKNIYMHLILENFAKVYGYLSILLGLEEACESEGP